ncbi:hypothetical protein pEaSNUABM12_00514 [Erwinia phage pEa_SNUABM_12]|uniref:Uncharacterized protein n=1 Tax=Erwinia phage pEa_SNUABM_12 TaxID=2768773 RepID=A0A7L8ZNC8_9CAUD|nr:hypothetical protein pEaSNUABM12_00514 [Erwinia phage pEa_SNUABM_12]
MKEGQSNSIQQSKELFESARSGNVMHLELGKYLFNNMNSVSFGKDSGWFNGAGTDDLEYIDAFISLRDEYSDLYSDYKVHPDSVKFFKCTIRPSYSHDLTLDIMDHCDFSTEMGDTILGMIKNYYNILNKTSREELTKDEVQNIDAILNKIDETEKKILV